MKEYVLRLLRRDVVPVPVLLRVGFVPIKPGTTLQWIRGRHNSVYNQHIHISEARDVTPRDILGANWRNAMSAVRWSKTDFQHSSCNDATFLKSLDWQPSAPRLRASNRNPF